ncbi:phosphoribosylformylglycinamidine cyclo-ligase [bacterium K02(2017)]|nr:phosphoribosylformylglycinamidine cyclo-ligase [bacterium K02(2017)]
MAQDETTYKKAGVDIAAGNQLVDRIKNLSQQTKRSEVISGIGGFSGLFSIANLNVKNPVLVAATDGIGTKLKIALDTNNYETIGQDLVAMCVNDLICCGAEPLFFLDYFATAKLDPDQAGAIIASIAKSLKSINCTLLGGETAEMPGLYQNNDFDMAGFSVGIVDKDKIIDGSQISIGSQVIGIESSGFHSNGYSLVRQIIQDQKLDLEKTYDFSDTSLGTMLLEPTALYVNPIAQLLKQTQILSMAHITGGGLVENIPRVLPTQCKCKIYSKAIKVPALFRFFQEKGNIPENEMWRVFNMGIGFVLIVKKEEVDNVIQKLNAMDYKAHLIGEIQKREKDEGNFIFD